MNNNWITRKSDFVEPFEFKEHEKINIANLARVSVDSPMLESFRRIFELKRHQALHCASGEDKNSLLPKLKKIENGLSKSLEAINELGQASRESLRFYVLYTEQNSISQRSTAKTKSKFDPTLEISTLLKAVEKMKKELIDSKNVRAINHTFFVESCVDVWIKNGGVIGSKNERITGWTDDETNPAKPLIHTIRYLLSLEGVHRQDPNYWIKKILG